MGQKIILLLALVVLRLLAVGQVNNSFNLMPAPATLTTNNNAVRVDQHFTLGITGQPDPRLYAEASRFIRRLGEKTGIFLDQLGYLTAKDSDRLATVLIRVRRPGKLKLGEDESYRLETNSGRVVVDAETDLGAIHALETLLQLVSTDANGYYIPGVSIQDEPRFAWRGLLLDVALHFMPVDEVKRTLDGIAAVKMNVLHLHLCNDQGFRVESKQFPRLQQLASDGKYYTQQEIRDLVSYAAQRGIRIVPEFVVPAHTTAILTAYPEFASVKRTYTLQRYFGVFDPVMDPTNEKLYPFLDRLFSEMAGLFPDEFFHIGGDENTGKDWEATPHIKAFMQARGMKNYMDLQTWFNQRLVGIVRKTGKTMMGWDEIFRPGIPKEVVIQSWRGNESFYNAVREGHRAILSYGYYIDLIQPASYHYQNDPIPDSVRLTDAEKRLVLGGEATMWSELVTPVTADSRIWPRTAAIAERLWSPARVNDVADMYRRLDIVSVDLEALGLRHRSYRGPLMRQLAGGQDTRALEVLVDVLEPLKIYDRNEGDTMYTVFSPFTKIADVAIPDQPEPRHFTGQVEDWLAHPSSGLEREIDGELRIWKDNDTAFARLLRNSPVLGEAASLSANLAALAAAGLEAMQYLHDGVVADSDWLSQALAVVKRARLQGARCEIQVVDPIEKLIERSAAAGLRAQSTRSGGQPVYLDTAFRQEYSVKYVFNHGLLKKVCCDRNGVAEVLSSAGLLMPAGGQLLYPGELVKAVAYLPTADKQVSGIGLYREQFVYANNKAVWSNAWAGQLYGTHTLPAVSVLCGGEDFSFLVAAGRSLQYLKDSKVLWEGRAGDSVLEILFDGSRGLFWLLDSHGITVFNPKDHSLREKYHGNGLTSFTLAAGDNELVVATHTGYWRLDATNGEPIGAIHDKLPCTDLTVVKEIDNRLWFGSKKGAFLLLPDGKYKYYSSRRWLPSDDVSDVTAGCQHSVWILTDKGLAEICVGPMTLYDKAAYFERQVRLRHIRLGFNATLSRMKNGDVTTGSLEDSDNDGLWTSMYLGAEVFRYAATRSSEALENVRESLDAMEQLYTVNSLKGFPSRSFERRGYEISDVSPDSPSGGNAGVRSARSVWRPSQNQQWDWKSTTSSDEAIGHMFVFGVIAELIPDADIRNKAIRLMDALMQHIVDHDLYMVDWNGKPTAWGRWNPEYVNARPKMVGDRKITSSNIISMLQTAYHFTGKNIYREKALELMYKYGYLENLTRPMDSIGPAPDDADSLSKLLSDGWNHSDDEMYFVGYWGLYRYALNDTLKQKFKAAILDHWQAERPEKEAAWDIFTAITGVRQFDLDEAVWYLRDYPLDLIDWKVTNSERRDLDYLPRNFRGQTVTEVLPPDELPINRHNANRFELDGGDENGGAEYSAGDIWLLPYWMGRYLQVISVPQN
jgi:hypothetical protein